jgi:hypothetical protein
VRDRDRLRKEHLERLGWRVHRLWSTAWFTDSAGELAKLRAAFDSAVGAAPPPVPESPADSDSGTGAGPTARPGPASQASPPPEAPPRSQVPPGTEEEPRPRPGPAADVVRVIPLGRGERPRLRASAAKALPAADETSPGALPPSPEPGAR